MASRTTVVFTASAGATIDSSPRIIPLRRRDWKRYHKYFRRSESKDKYWPLRARLERVWYGCAQRRDRSLNSVGLLLASADRHLQLAGGQSRLLRRGLSRLERVWRTSGGVSAVQLLAQVKLLLGAIMHAFTPVDLTKFEVQRGSVRRQRDCPFQFGLRLGQILLCPYT